ncbi:MAG: hypothetical protein GY765_01235 [bacterium]|nr:hypothetical protein [bacterium]
MKNKYSWLKVAGIAFLITLVVLYMLFYFMPTISETNRLKRKLKDMSSKIDNFLQIEKEFAYSDRQERSYFKLADDEIKSRLPVINSRENFIRLFTDIFDEIKTLAQRDGIYNLMLTSNSSELELNAPPLASDEKSLEELQKFASVRLKRIESKMYRRSKRYKTTRSTKKQDAGEPAPLFKNLSSGTVFVSFSGNLKNAAAFINHIPWSDYYLRVDNITVAACNLAPCFMLHLKIYYIDERKKEVAHVEQ